MMKRIKVLFIHHELVCGGAEQALFDLICLMDKEKFDITVLVQVDGGIWEQKFRDAGIKVVSIWSCQKSSRNPLVKLENLQKRNRISKALTNDGAGLVDICFQNDFDIIVSYSVWLMQRMGFSKNAKTVKFIHGDIASNPKYCESIVDFLDVIRRFNRIICVSDVARRSFESITGITEGVCTHFNPLNSAHVSLLAQQDVLIPNDMPLVCAVGRLAKEKGFERLIRIHQKICNEGLLHKLVIVGEGPEKERLINTIREVHGEDSVILAGYTDNPYPYIQKSKFLVCSSYTEGLPLVAMEALSLGIPVVSAVPSIGELFGHEMCGLVTENDDTSLEAGVRQMLSDEVFYMRAKAGAERRSRFFNGDRMVREIEDEFISLAT